jgi:para-nitrobenzyl esterase
MSANVSVQQGPIIETAQGKLRGASIDGINIFKGIPYARSARFQPPQPVEPWSGICDALALGPSTPQPKRAAEVPWWDWITGRQLQSEDCLVLNVFAPASAAGRKLPVMSRRRLHHGVGLGARCRWHATGASR